jgi:uncharacterized delta-60 repeat protein
MTSNRRRSIVLARAVFALVCVAAGDVLAAPGDLDPTFDGDGKKTIDYTGVDLGGAVAVQPDGKIVVVGNGNPNADVAVARLEPDGSFDPTFDGDGVVGVDFGAFEFGNAVALQPDGKIVVAGFSRDPVQAGSDEDIIVLRLRPDGTLDPEFDADGGKRIEFGGLDSADAVVVQPDGRIVIVGQGLSSSVVVVRLNPDGSFDPTLEDDGILFASFGGTDDDGHAVALQPDGKIVVAGSTNAGGGQMGVMRLHADGTFDTSFDFDGKRTIAFGAPSAAAAVAIQPDGAIIVAGAGGPLQDIAVARLAPDGALDPTFAGDGATLVDLGGDDHASALALQSNGKIVLVGDADEFDVAAVRLHPDGALDLGFDGIGSVLVDFGSDEEGRGVVLQADGKIVIAGSTRVSNQDFNTVVVRMEGDPPVATTTTTLPPTVETDHAIAVKVAVVKPGRLVKLVAKGTFVLPAAADAPTVAGGSLVVLGTRGDVTYPLGASSWTALGRRRDGTKGYRFRGEGCSVLVKPRLVKAVCRGNTGTLAVPEPGPVLAVLTLGAETTRYCAACGGTARGNGDKVFKRVACAAPPGCPLWVE